MAELIGLGMRFAVLAPLGVHFRDCVVPEVGKFSTGRSRFQVLGQGMIKSENWSRSVNAAPGAEKEETERAADTEDKEVSLCSMA